MRSAKAWGWRRAAGACFFWMGSLLPAQAPPSGEIPPAFWDAAIPATPPAWFGPVQVSTAINMTLWRAAVRPPTGQARLAVTLVMDESQGGFARLIWQGSGRAVTVCGNLFEGAASLHQRTLLLDRETMVGPGELVVEATGERPAILRAELFWVEPLVLAASGRIPPGLYLSPSGKIFPADEMQGSGRRAPQDDRRGNLVDAVLDAGPVSIPAQSLARFLVSLASPPVYARLEAQVAGLGPGDEPSLRVNGQPLTAVSVELPGLDDAGYRWISRDPGPVFGGWRTVTAFVPAGFLRMGENQVDWQGPTGSRAMTVRHLRLQVGYDPPSMAGGGASAAPPRTSPVPAPAVSRAIATSFASPPRPRLGLSSGTSGVGLRPE